MKNDPRNTFSRLGFAQVAGIAATIFISEIALKPLASEANMQKIVDIAGPSAMLLLIYIPQIFFLLAFWLVVRSMPKTDWQKENLNFKTLLQLFLMMYAASSVLNTIGSAISKAAPAGGTEQLDLIEKIESTKLLMGYLIPNVIGPILEEVIFRKLMLDRTRCFGEKTAIIFSAVCFGLFHGNLTQFLYAACVGLFLGYVYCKTGKVLYTIVMHMLLNGFSAVILAVVPLLNGGNEEALAVAMIGALLLVVLIGVMTVAGFIILYRWIKHKTFALDESMPECIPAGEVLKTVYLNPGVILLFVISIYGIIADLFNLYIDLPFFGKR